MALLSILGRETDVGVGLTLVLEPDDVLAFIRLTNFLDVFLEALVRKEWGGLRSGRRRARQRSGALSDIRQELRGLEWVRLLLKELVVERSEASLLRLLLGLAGRHLGLSASEAGGLGLLA